MHTKRAYLVWHRLEARLCLLMLLLDGLQHQLRHFFSLLHDSCDHLAQLPVSSLHTRGQLSIFGLVLYDEFQYDNIEKKNAHNYS